MSRRGRVAAISTAGVGSPVWVGAALSCAGTHAWRRVYGLYLTKNVSTVVWQKSITTQIRELIVYISNFKGYVDGCVGELTSANPL